MPSGLAFQSVCPWSFHESWTSCKLFFNIFRTARRTSWNCVIRQGDSCCAYLISPKWHHFPGSGEWALLCTLFLALSNSVHVAFIILFSSWWFLAFSISEKKLCHNLFFFFSCLFVLCFASTGKSSGCFVIYIPFPASVCVPIALIFAPCVSPLTPAASACYFQHLSMLLLVSQTQNCIFKMLGLMLLVARVFRPKKHKGLSSFSPTVSVNPAVGYVVSYFPCSCQTLLHFVVQTYLSPSMHRDVSLLQI